MYGLVNKAIEDLLRTRFGDDAWEATRQQAGVESLAFVRMESYPDDITYRLIDAASQHLAIPASELLEAFGEYWTVYTGQEGYGELLSSSGQSLIEFLQNLDNLHARVGLIYPDLTAPHFQCTDITADSLVLHYYTQRPGLAPMVVGLLKGLGVLYKTPLSVTQVMDRQTGADHDAFLLRLGTP